MPKSKPYNPKKTPSYDRFITRMTDAERDIASFKIRYPEENKVTPYTRALSQALFGCDDIHTHPILPVIPSRRIEPPSMKIIDQLRSNLPQPPQPQYKIAPGRILEASNTVDDFYTSNIHLSNTTMVVGLGNYIYSYHLSKNKVSLSFRLYNGDLSNAVMVNQNSQLTAVSRQGHIYRFNLATKQFIHHGSLSSSHIPLSIESSSSPDKLFIGTRSGMAALLDYRTPQKMVLTFNNIDVNEPPDMVCGLSFQRATDLLACGLNNNKVQIWDIRQNAEPTRTMSDHQAAVKGLQFHPAISNLLASGGGSQDRTVKVWNTLNGKEYASIDVGGQVSSLMWSNTNTKCLMATHDQSLSLFRFSKPAHDLTRVDLISPHNRRVLTAAQAPNCKTIATLGADDKIRFFSTSIKNKRLPDKEPSMSSDTFHTMIR